MTLSAGPGKFSLESLSAALEIIISYVYFASQKQNQSRAASKEVEFRACVAGCEIYPRLLCQRKSILAWSFISTLQVLTLRGFL